MMYFSTMYRPVKLYLTTYATFNVIFTILILLSREIRNLKPFFYIYTFSVTNMQAIYLEDRGFYPY